MRAKRSAFPALIAGGFLAVLAGGCSPAAAQQADRERAQMLQMQQQLQRLQSDNAAISKERNALQAKVEDADKLKKESDATAKALARIRQEFAAQAKELAALRAQLASASEKLTTAQSEDELLRKTVAARDDAAQAAATAKRHADAAIALLEERLKAQTARGDVCEIRHEGLMKFSSEVIDRYEADRLRLCEPVTGIWKVRAQTQIQDLRDTLYGFRLDIPPPQRAAASGDGGTGAAGGQASAGTATVAAHSADAAPAAGAPVAH